MLQNYIQRNKQYHGIWKIFMLLGTKIKKRLEKTAHAQLGYYTRKLRKI